MADQCRSCHAEVIFVPSATTGKPMILDAKPEKRVLVETRTEFVDDLPTDREFQTARVVSVHIDHHATCPAAAAWKGRRR